MAITNRTRKMLWGRAAGRCTLCNSDLVLDPSDSADREAVVGDECHIVAQQPGGARAGRPPGGIDDYDNLILLCGVDHKRVDDQPGHFTIERLKALKAEHERRIAHTGGLPDIRIVDDPTAGPFVVRLTVSGRELWKLTAGADAWAFDHPDPADEAEVEMLGRFLANIKDWSEIASELGPGEAVRGAFALSQDLDALSDRGFAVYASRRRRLLTSGTGSTVPWWEAHVRIVRSSETVRDA